MSEQPHRPESGDEPWDLEPEAAASTPEPEPTPAREPRGKLEAEPILKLEDEACPKCGAPLEPDQVVCLKCGYDMQANTVRTVERRVESVPEEAEEVEPFVAPGRGSPRALALVGSVVAVGAMVIAGMGVPPAESGWVVLAAVLLVVYDVVLHTGTGIVAVGVAARINEERFGGEEALPLAAARVFVAMAVFELVLHLSVQIPYVGQFLAWPLAGGAYWLVVWGLFSTTKTVALVIVLTQVILWVLVQMGMWLAAWYSLALRTS